MSGDAAPGARPAWNRRDRFDHPPGRERFRLTCGGTTSGGQALTEASVDAANDSTLPAAFTLLADRILDVTAPRRLPGSPLTRRRRSLDAYRAYIDGVAARIAGTSMRRAPRSSVRGHDPQFALAWTS